MRLNTFYIVDLLYWKKNKQNRQKQAVIDICSSKFHFVVPHWFMIKLNLDITRPTSLQLTLYNCGCNKSCDMFHYIALYKNTRRQCLILPILVHMMGREQSIASQNTTGLRISHRKRLLFHQIPETSQVALTYIIPVSSEFELLSKRVRDSNFCLTSQAWGGTLYYEELIKIRAQYHSCYDWNIFPIWLTRDRPSEFIRY